MGLGREEEEPETRLPALERVAGVGLDPLVASSAVPQHGANARHLGSQGLRTKTPTF